MNTGVPEGHFARGLLIFGTPGSGGVAAKGYLIHPPDLRGASIGYINAYQDRIRALLAGLGEGWRLQFQWTVDSDYLAPLAQYYRESLEVVQPHAREVRLATWRLYWEKMARRELRRERLVLFVSTALGALSVTAKGGPHERYANILGQLVTQFDEVTGTLRTALGADTRVEPMGDREHFACYARFLNPSFAERVDLDLTEQFNPAFSIQDNCWNSDGVSLARTGFYLDGRFHAVFALKRWPSRTYPGIIHRLTGLPLLDYQITVNLVPLPPKQEVEKEERAIERLRGEYESTSRHSLLVAVGKKERKIESLSTGFIRPFETTYIIRVWDETESGLAAKCSAVKNAIHGLGGAQYYECALPSTAKKLFFATWPGWTGSRYRHRNLYAEDSYLADVLPFSSTFTGQLEGAEALYGGSQNNLVGVRTFLGDPATPQHTVLFGATGAGKSVFMRNLLGQTAGRFAYTVIIEEGLSYADFVQEMGARPIVLHPDGDLTLNYLDTGGMPLSQLQVATAVALVSRMIGEAADAEAQQTRQAVLAQYVNQLYEDGFEEWSRRHAEALPRIRQMACAAHRWRRERLGAGSSLTEAFADLRDRLAGNEDEAASFLAGIGEAEITSFLKDPGTERLVMAVGHAEYTRADYPRHAALVELMQFGRFPEHRKEMVDQIATLLSAWTAHGQYGALFDGPTNISLTGEVAHFELGQIPEQAIELKTAAGLLISGFMRQHIISLPRRLRKRIIYEELARFLDVPGGEKIVAESYAQLRKFNCWTASIIQQYGKFKASRIRSAVIGNSKQFLLMRQFDRSDIDDLAADISLPPSVCASVQNYPMPEQLPPGQKYSSVCLFSPVTDPPLCGTVRHTETIIHENLVTKTA